MTENHAKCQHETINKRYDGLSHLLLHAANARRSIDAKVWLGRVVGMARK